MNHLGHMVVGGIVGAVTMLILKEFSLSLIAVCLLGSILPDIDLKQSKASKIVQPIATLGIAFLLYPFISAKFSMLTAVVVSLVISAAVIFLVLFPLRLRHRGITHSWLAATVFSIVAAVALGINSGIIAFISYASHLVVDRI